jgi:AraC-like DNA-binding protein
MKNPVDLLPCPSTYSRLLLQHWPSSAERLLAGTDLTPAMLVRHEAITVAQHLQVLRNARDVASHESWALDFGRRLSISSHGPMGFAALSAPTLSQSIETIAMFARTRAPYVGFSVKETGRQLILRFDLGKYPLGDLEVPMIEILQQVVLSYIQALLGKENGDPVLCFPYASHGYAARYRESFGSRCEFSAGFAGLALSMNLAALPCPLHDEKIYRSSLSGCREALEGILEKGDVVLRASHWLAAHFEQIASNRTFTSLPRLAQLASAWGVTTRTVIRQLAEHDVSFSELRSTQQLEMARRLLDDAAYTISEIGYLLGYGDPANFGRAFKRLSGQSPSDYRRRAHQSLI